MRIAITGGTGVVGRPLVSRLVGSGHEVTVLSRHGGAAGTPGVRFCSWDPATGAGLEAQFAGMDAVVHLARSPLPTWFTPDTKAQLMISRLTMVRALVDAMARVPGRPPSFVCASSHDIYGARPHGPVPEETPPGDDPMAHLYAAVEAEALGAASHGARVVLARIGVVLGQGAPNPKFITHVLADPTGPLSWIHTEDLAAMLDMVVQEDISGPVNMTTPSASTGRIVSSTIAAFRGGDRALPSAKRDALVSAIRANPKRAMPSTPTPPEIEPVVYQPHWAVPSVMTRAGFVWKTPRVEDALRYLLV